MAEGFLLTIPERGPVLPRRVRVTLSPGAGRLAVPERTDPAWRASVANAWAAATALAGRADADVTVEVPGAGALAGGSAGLPVGLLALADLLDATLPPHFATGAVLDPAGYLAGGAAAEPKARAARDAARALLLPGAALHTPPIPTLPAVGIPVAPAPDLATALAHLDPALHARVAARHRALRAPPPGAPPRGPFALVRGVPAAPAEVAGIRVLHEDGPAPAGATPIAVGEDALVAWRALLPAGADLAAEIPHVHALGTRWRLRP